MAGVVEVMMPRTDRVRGLVGRSGLRIGLGCGRRRRGWLRRRADRGAPRSAASRGLLRRARRRARTRGTELLYCHGLSSQEPPSVSRASTTATMPPSPGPAQARPPAGGAVVLEPVAESARIAGNAAVGRGLGDPARGLERMVASHDYPRCTYEHLRTMKAAEGLSRRRGFGPAPPSGSRRRSARSR